VKHSQLLNDASRKEMVHFLRPRFQPMDHELEPNQAQVALQKKFPILTGHVTI
jgi:hypothetical protein